MLTNLRAVASGRAVGDFGAEGVGVALQRGLHRLLPDGLVLHVVAAVRAVAPVAVHARGKALAVPAWGEAHVRGVDSHRLLPDGLVLHVVAAVRAVAPVAVRARGKALAVPACVG
jgi:hypothetical protein